MVYTTAGDDRVRESHEELDGITLPKNHSFWDTYYPPLGWNCRCSTFPTTTNRRTPDDQIPHGVIDNVPPMFRTNIAKEGLAFPEGHPYRKNKVKVPKKEIEKENDKKQERKKEKTIREKHLSSMMPLLKKSMIRYVGNDLHIKIGFSKKGNKHIVDDFLSKTSGLSKKDLTKLHSVLKYAEFVKSSKLYKDRTDNIQKFYYFKNKGKNLYYNVAEVARKKKNGKIQLERFLYSITNDIPTKE